MLIKPFVIGLAMLGTVALATPRTDAADPTPAPSTSGAAGEKVVTLPDGLQYVDVKVGIGPSPKKDQTAVVKYTISVGGKRIEGSGASQPLEFVLGKGQTLKAIDEGVSTMKVGGQRKLHVPPELAYGSEGVPGRVPPSSTLDIDLELLSVR